MGTKVVISDSPYGGLNLQTYGLSNLDLRYIHALWIEDQPSPVNDKVSISFIEGEDCQYYYDGYHSDIGNIGYENSVINDQIIVPGGIEHPVEYGNGYFYHYVGDSSFDLLPFNKRLNPDDTRIIDQLLWIHYQKGDIPFSDPALGTIVESHHTRWQINDDGYNPEWWQYSVYQPLYHNGDWYYYNYWTAWIGNSKDYPVIYDDLRDALKSKLWRDPISYQVSLKRVNLSQSSKVLIEPYKFDTLAVKHRKPTGLASELCREAISNYSCNTNNIANLLSLLDLIKGLKSTKSLPGLLQSVRNLKFSKVPANLWLKYRYQYKTTLSDIEEIVRFSNRISNFTDEVKSGQQVDQGTMRVKVILNLDESEWSQSQIAGFSGLAPSLYNLWDLVPYSFVIDWFIGFGSFLEDLQSQSFALALDIQSVTTSWRWSEPELQGDCNLLYYNHYERLVSSTMPPFIPYSSDPSDSTILKRIIDGVSLLIGR